MLWGLKFTQCIGIQAIGAGRPTCKQCIPTSKAVRAIREKKNSRVKNFLKVVLSTEFNVGGIASRITLIHFVAWGRGGLPFRLLVVPTPAFFLSVR